MKKIISVQIPASLSASLDELAKKTGRKKNLLFAASLSSFLSTTPEEQEKTIRKFLEAQRD